MFSKLSSLLRQKTTAVFMTFGTAAVLLQFMSGFIGDTILSFFLLGLLHLRCKI